jgi:hypothetical protein
VSTICAEQKFLLTPMGENTIKKIIPKLNDLSDGLKLPHATSHTGRVTAASVSVNNAGVDPVIVAKTTKHKDLRVLSGYIKEDLNVKLATGRAIGKRIAEGISIDDGEGEDIDENADPIIVNNAFVSDNCEEEITFKAQKKKDNEQRKQAAAPIIINYYSNRQENISTTFL